MTFLPALHKYYDVIEVFECLRKDDKCSDTSLGENVFFLHVRKGNLYQSKKKYQSQVLHTFSVTFFPPYSLSLSPTCSVSL